MIGRRKKPDGLPFRLYQRDGKRIVSFGYKDAEGLWAFRLSAPRDNAAKVAEIRKQAIDRANELNGDVVLKGTVSDLLDRYFKWQLGLPTDSERRKADSTLEENERERKWLDKVFGKMAPAAVQTPHIYAYLDHRGIKAPSKANKEIALLSAAMEYGRRTGEVKDNPCRGIKYNPTQPKTSTVRRQDMAYALREARRRGGAYLVLALGFRAAWLGVCRPDELRALHRSAITDDGLDMAVGKRKKGQAQRKKLVSWSPRLRMIIRLALRLQKTPSVYIFPNQQGQVYTRSGWSSNWRRLMSYCEDRAGAEGRQFTRFALSDMRPTAVTQRMDEGDDRITDATGHRNRKMVDTIYDRRRIRRVRATD